jgi:hypothetical protein
MGLLNKYNAQDTNFAPYDGRTPGQATNPGATKQSKLHAFGDTPGYSLNGAYFNDVNNASNIYDNGSPVALPLPSPSVLDLNGVTPAGYQAPEVGIPTDRLQDITG